MSYPLRSVWTGSSPLPEGVVVVASAARWDAARATWPPALRAQVGEPAVAWDHEAVLVVAGAETNDHVTSLAGKLGRTGDRVVLDVVFRGQPVDLYAPGHPTLVAVVPAAAFAEPMTPQLTWNGQPWAAPARVDR